MIIVSLMIFLPLAVPCLVIVIVVFDNVDIGFGNSDNCDAFPTFCCDLFGCSLSRAAFTAPVTREI